MSVLACLWCGPLPARWRIAPVVLCDSGRLQWLPSSTQANLQLRARGLLGRGAHLVLLSGCQADTQLSHCRDAARRRVWHAGGVDDHLWRRSILSEDWAPCCHSVLVLRWPHFRFAACKHAALCFMSLHEKSIVALKMWALSQILGFPRLIPKMIHNVLLML